MIPFVNIIVFFYREAQTFMELLPEKPYLRTLFITFYIIIGIALFYVVVRFLGRALLPFALAWVTAAALQRPTVAIESRMHVSRKAAALCITIAAVALTATVVYLIAGAALRESSGLIALIGENADTISDTIGTVYDKIGAISDRLGIGKSAMGTGAAGALTELISAAAAYVSSAAGKVLGAIPGALIFIVVYTVSTVSFVGLYRPAVSRLYDRFPRAAQFMSKIKSTVFDSIRKYAVAYSAIFALTFAELFFGLTLIGVKYAFVIALATAAIDILPVLGTGIVMVPWAAFCFITGQTARGACLLILYGVVCVIRQIAEPKIVGTHLGISPVVTMAAMYLGYVTAGAAGLIFAPFIAVVAYSVAGAYAQNEI